MNFPKNVHLRSTPAPFSQSPHLPPPLFRGIKVHALLIECCLVYPHMHMSADVWFCISKKMRKCNMCPLKCLSN